MATGGITIRPSNSQDIIHVFPWSTIDDNGDVKSGWSHVARIHSIDGVKLVMESESNFDNKEDALSDAIGSYTSFRINDFANPGIYKKEGE